MNDTTNSSPREYLGRTLERTLQTSKPCPLADLKKRSDTIGIGILTRISDAMNIQYVVDPLVYRITPLKGYKFKQIHNLRENYSENIIGIAPQKNKDRFKVHFLYKDTALQSVSVEWSNTAEFFFPEMYFIRSDEEILPFSEEQRDYLILAHAALQYNHARLQQELKRSEAQEKISRDPSSKKETIKINLPPRPTAPPTIRLPPFKSDS